MGDSECEPLKLNEEVTHILEECRMVLPGIQALFGFQLVAVFNTSFREVLSFREQCLHLGAIACSAVAVALVMAPAAMHRIGEPRSVSRRLVDAATRLLEIGMVPLMLGICTDFYLIARVTLHRARLSAVLALMLLAMFVGLWLLVPRWHRERMRSEGRVARHG
jgi:DMSO reductase anchor subunit